MDTGGRSGHDEWRDDLQASGSLADRLDGRQYWVGEHLVSRDDWDRASGWPQVDYERIQFRVKAADGRSVCSTRTFPTLDAQFAVTRFWFFRNENGGCADSDALGKPWPKHPCMDRQTLGLSHRQLASAKGMGRCIPTEGPRNSELRTAGV